MSELKFILNETYLKRQAINSRYSRNAFARNLGVSPTALSQYLSGKRQFSPKNLRNVIASLCLPNDYFQREKTELPSLDKAQRLSLDTFALISDWYHYAILNLVEIESITTATQIARRLNISKDTAVHAIDRLLNLGFLKMDKNLFQRQVKSLDVGADIPSAAIRKHNREKIELAILALSDVDVSLRDISSLTLTFDLRKMVSVKKEIKKFKDRILKLSEANGATEVYSMNVQFFPLSNKLKK